MDVELVYVISPTVSSIPVVSIPTRPDFNVPVKVASLTHVPLAESHCAFVFVASNVPSLSLQWLSCGAAEATPVATAAVNENDKSRLRIDIR